jgi:hypothetical protein
LTVTSDVSAMLEIHELQVRVGFSVASAAVGVPVLVNE